MSDQEPDSGVPQSPPGPESETGAADTEVFASAEFATGPAEVADEGGQNADEKQASASTAAEGEPVRESIQQPVRESIPEPVREQISEPAPMYAPVPAAVPAYGYGYGLGAAPTPQPEPGASAEPKKGRRARWIIGLGLGYAVLAGGTAFGVIAGKSPAAVDVTAVSASAYAAPVGSASASPSPSASSHASTKATHSAAATTAAPTTAPPTTAIPTSTVTGRVSDGTHSGDLRYFLLPPPQGPSSVQGDPDGTTQSLDDVLTTYTDPSTVRTSLQQLGFKTGAERTYQDSTMGANVTIQLMQFGSSSASSEWLSSFSYSGGGYQSISVPGESGAEGWSYAKDGNYELIGAYREGDTFYEVLVYGAQLIPAQSLGQVISAEHARLANG